MKIVVTGSSGLLGRHIASALTEAGHDVLGIDAVAPAEAAWDHVTSDITDLGLALQLIRNAGAVIHAAAIPRPAGHAAAEVFKTNVALTYNAVEAAALAGIGRFVYASSFSVFGYPFFERDVRPPSLPVDQHHPIGAQDVYAVSKWLGEEIVEAAVRRGAFSAVSLRMPWIQTAQLFFETVVPRRGGAESQRDLWSYLDARDAAQGFVKAIAWAGSGHARVILSAADTYMEEDTEPLARRAFPGIAFTQALLGNCAVLDTTHAWDTLGFAAQHSWRSYAKPEAVA